VYNEVDDEDDVSEDFDVDIDIDGDDACSVCGCTGLVEDVNTVDEFIDDVNGDGVPAPIGGRERESAEAEAEAGLLDTLIDVSALEVATELFDEENEVLAGAVDVPCLLEELVDAEAFE
jgi:hypothetical protein